MALAKVVMDITTGEAEEDMKVLTPEQSERGRKAAEARWKREASRRFST